MRCDIALHVVGDEAREQVAVKGGKEFSRNLLRKSIWPQARAHAKAPKRMPLPKLKMLLVSPLHHKKVKMLQDDNKGKNKGKDKGGHKGKGKGKKNDRKAPHQIATI